MKPTPALYLFTVLLISLLAGCGPDRPQTVAVGGKVTFDGGPPPAAGMVYFAPLEPAEGFPRRAGQAAFDASGQYEATSFEPGDGLRPGKYRVRVACWRQAPMLETDGVSYVAADASLADLELSVDSRGVEYDIDVPLAK